MNIRSPLFAWSLLLALTQVGCVALNVPSQRFHDPHDQGGVFGPWSQRHGSLKTQHDCVADPSTVDGIMGETLEVDPFDTTVGPDGKPKPKPPEVPWPRFHPVPTKPVFGPASP